LQEYHNNGTGYANLKKVSIAKPKQFSDVISANIGMLIFNWQSVFFYHIRRFCSEDCTK